MENPNLSEEPFIPPYYMLVIALVGLVVALLVFFTQPSFSVVGWGGLGIAALSFIGWVLMAPQQARAVLTGRAARFGGLSVIVTIIVLVALVLLYILIRGQDWRLDLTERDTFSLTTESEEAIVGVGVDPNIRPVKLIAFYDASQAGRRDQDVLLFEDYQRTSEGKVTYEFVNPDQNPALAQQYGIDGPGQIMVVGQTEAGELDIENAEKVNFFSQDELTNAILRVAASGDFRAYFLSVTDGLELDDSTPTGMNTLNDALVNQYGWTMEPVSFLQLIGDEPDVLLNDPAADGDVLVVAGGSAELTDVELQVITDYLDAGGSVIIYAAQSINPDNTALAADPELNEYLFNNFGVRFNNDIVLDATQAIQTPLLPAIVDFSRNNYVTQNFPTGTYMIMELPRSIEVASSLPGDVTVDELARTSAEAYSKTDLQAVIEGVIDAAETDPKGPFVVGAAAQNTTTGAKVILFGSASIPTNQFANANRVMNLDAAFNSLIWATNFNDYFAQVTIQSQQRPEDTPISVDQQTNSLINLITIVLMPFGILLVGLVVWWNSRETALKKG